MFGGLSKMFDMAVETVLADRVFPIHQGAVNTALSAIVISIPELTALSMEIHDGNFDLLAEGKKGIAFKTRTQFEITSCEISAEKQVIVFRRISPTEITAESLLDRILIAVFKALVCRIFQLEPANFVLEGQPGITVQGDNYTVDLAKTELSRQAAPQIEAFLKVVGSLMRVKELRCLPEKMEALIGM